MDPSTSPSCSTAPPTHLGRAALCEWARRLQLQRAERERKKAFVSPERLTDEKIYGYAVRRETARLRRVHLGIRDPQKLYDIHDVMVTTKVTNVHDSNDPTSESIASALGPLNKEWRELPPHADGSWTSEHHTLAFSILLTATIAKLFGQKEFIDKLGESRSWGGGGKQNLLNCANAHRANGGHCFTDAYYPPKGDRGEESVSKARAATRYEDVCARVGTIWRFRHSIGAAAEATRSLQEVYDTINDLNGFRGSGFIAKEIAVVLSRTPLFAKWDGERWVQDCVDLDTWCAVPRRTRRALNRRSGRPVAWNIDSVDPAIVERFHTEITEVFEKRHKLWPTTIEGHSVEPMHKHDISFWLCEADKIERRRLGQGSARSYHPPSASETASAPASASASATASASASASASTKKRVRNLASELARAPSGSEPSCKRLRMASIAPSTRVTNPGFVFRYNGGQYMTVAAFALERGFRSSSLPRFTTLEEHEFHRSETLMVRDIIDARSLKDVPRELKVGQVDLADAAAIRAVNHGDWAGRFALGSEKKTYRWKACRALFNLRALSAVDDQRSLKKAI